MKTNPDDFVAGPLLVEPISGEKAADYATRLKINTATVLASPALTKREYFASQIMATLTSGWGSKLPPPDLAAAAAVQWADMLILALNKGKV